VTDRTAREPAASHRFPGPPRTRGISTHTVQRLDTGWVFAPVGPSTDASALDAADWKPALVPGTVASAQRANGGLDLERAPDFDATSWAYRCAFAAPPANPDERAVLCFDGLATLAEVWLNGQQILSSDNMFVAHEVDVTGQLAANNDLLIRFHALRAALDMRRPRPRWRTKLVEHQQLRWFRTTLLGRMPGWSPPVRAVGPWRPVRLERRRALAVVGGDIYPHVDGTGKRVDAALVVRAVAGCRVTGATLHVGDRRTALSATTSADLTTLAGTLDFPDAHEWWPHTHGAQPLYDGRVVVQTEQGDVTIDLGRVAFRRVAANRADDGFAIEINGEGVFCRGACWTTPDIVDLGAPESKYRELLTLARDAGMNMLRVGGTMVYEADCFYDLCDELGLLVWHEFMFANMDYPTDGAFVDAVTREATQVVARIRRHPCVAVFCGNSEVEQQAAMLGLDRELWSSAIFRDVLPACCEAGAPGVPYVPSSPSGGALPFHVDSGVAHYFGVGAYLRPLDDARRAGVRFTSECLGFSNLPEQHVIDALLPNGESPFHHPRWKARVPRDHGAGWDFEDIRDHYLATLFGVDPMRLRYADVERYVAMSRVVTGEVMARTIGEWRRAGSSCHGAIVWFYQDLWLGAGWGVLDAAGRPKAAYYSLKRAMQPVAAAITDEGVNGLNVHIANDRATPLDAELRVLLLRGAGTIVASVETPVQVPARGTHRIVVDAILGRFHDSAYAYRFGPPGHDVVAATVTDARGQVLSEAFHFSHGLPSAQSDDTLVSGHATRTSDRTVEITLRAAKLAQFVAIQADGYLLDDNYFHMTPGAERVIVARAHDASARFDGFVQPLNAHDGVRIGLVDRAARAGDAQ
jgi:beta-mannosidase